MGYSSEKDWPLWSRYVYCYLLWGGLSALGFWLLMQLRINLIDIYAHFQFDRWAFAAVHNFSIVILALVWLSYVVLIEEYLRQGIKLGRVFPRAIRVLWVVGALLGISYLLQRLIVI